MGERWMLAALCPTLSISNNALCVFLILPRTRTQLDYKYQLLIIMEWNHTSPMCATAEPLQLAFGLVNPMAVLAHEIYFSVCLQALAISTTMNESDLSWTRLAYPKVNLRVCLYLLYSPIHSRVVVIDSKNMWLSDKCLIAHVPSENTQLDEQDQDKKTLNEPC